MNKEYTNNNDNHNNQQTSRTTKNQQEGGTKSTNNAKERATLTTKCRLYFKVYVYVCSATKCAPQTTKGAQTNKTSYNEGYSTSTAPSNRRRVSFVEQKELTIQPESSFHSQPLSRSLSLPPVCLSFSSLPLPRFSPSFARSYLLFILA